MKNKLKIMLLLSMLLTFMFVLTGCAEEELNFEVDNDLMQSQTKEIINQYVEVTPAQKDYYLSEGDELQKTAIAGFEAAQTTDHVGYFMDFKDGTTSNGVDGKVNFSQICRFEHRDVKVTVSYKQNKAFDYDKEKLYTDLSSQASQYGLDTASFVSQMYGNYPELDLTSMDAFLDSYLAAAYGEYPYIAEECEVSAVYSTKELVAQGGKNTAIGMGVVFIVLIFISFVISLLKYLPLLFDADIRKAKAEKKKAHDDAKKQTEERILAASGTEKAAPQVAFAKDDLMNDAELVAVITAAINAAAGGARGPAYTASKDTLVVRSIRRR